MKNNMCGLPLNGSHIEIDDELVTNYKENLREGASEFAKKFFDDFTYSFIIEHVYNYHSSPSLELERIATYPSEVQIELWQIAAKILRYYLKIDFIGIRKINLNIIFSFPKEFQFTLLKSALDSNYGICVEAIDFISSFPTELQADLLKVSLRSLRSEASLRAIDFIPDFPSEIRPELWQAASEKLKSILCSKYAYDNMSYINAVELIPSFPESLRQQLWAAAPEAIKFALGYGSIFHYAGPTSNSRLIALTLILTIPEEFRDDELWEVASKNLKHLLKPLFANEDFCLDAVRLIPQFPKESQLILWRLASRVIKTALKSHDEIIRLKANKLASIIPQDIPPENFFDRLSRLKNQIFE